MSFGTTPRLTAWPTQGTSAVPGVPVSGGALPEFAYTPTAGLGDNSGAYMADYYGQMAKTYLPQVDTFAQANAGKMVDWNPNQFMTVEDFGIGGARGDLRKDLEPGYFIGDQFNEGTPSGFYQQGKGGYYATDIPEEYGGGGTKVVDGEVFTRTNAPVTNSWDGETTDNFTYTSAGAYRKETPEEAFARMQGQGGDTVSGGRNDFGGQTTLDDLTKDHSGKWGADPVNMPEMKQYINDPNWVAKDADGNITGMRAELLPVVFREQLGEEFRDITRGGTKESNVMGDLVFTVILGVMTMGVGTAAASAAGLTTATAAGGMTGAITGGSALSTTGSMVAGGVSGGLSAAAKGGNIGQGILTGGIGGGLSPMVSGGLASTGIDMLDKGTLFNNALTGGVVGAGRSAATGGNAGDIGTSFVAGSGTSLVMEGLAYNGLTTGVGAIDNVVGGLVNQAIGGAVDFGSDAQSPAQAEPDAVESDVTPDVTTAPRYSVPVRNSNIKYVKR